jgi:hypothetical protein
MPSPSTHMSGKPTYQELRAVSGSVVFSPQVIPVKNLIPWDVLVVVVLVACALRYRYKRSETEKAIAVFSDYGTSTAERETALKVLTKDTSPETTKTLIAIALSPNARPDSPTMLIPVLAARRDPETPEALSQFLQPHIAPAIRAGAADALKQTGCSYGCILNTLHNKERLWKGDVPIELDVKQGEDAKQYFQNEENAINDALDFVLQHNSHATLQQLRRVYGLGSMQPSYFALSVLQELTLVEACKDLSKPYLQQIANAERRKAIDAALEHNNCETSR